jgi:hypothetical protein
MKARIAWPLPLMTVLAACGSGSDGPTTPAANRPPVVTVAQNPAGGAIVGVTTLTFTASASDADGDALTCTWDLGDGTPRTGTSVARAYAQAGNFPANVTCTDGRGGSTTAGSTVLARSLEGDWLPLQNGVPGDRAVIRQEGATLNGYADSGCCRHTFEARLAQPRAATVQFRYSGCKKNDIPLTGTVSADLNRIDLTGTNCTGQATFAFVRQ